jgi:hypothetical protein
MEAMTTITHLRGIPALRALRGQHAAVVVCLDDPTAFEERTAELEALDARLVVEREPGPLSERLGRPLVTICDRYLEVVRHEAHLAPEDAVRTARLLEIRCEECPQSGVDMHQAAGDWGRARR